MSKITFSHNFLWVNFRRNFTFLLGLCLSVFIFNLNTDVVFALYTPTLSVSVDNAAVNVNGNQVINSVNGTTELPINLTVNTTNKTGYTATLNTETNETALVNSGSTNGAKIDSITASRSILNLPVNSWGFKTSNETSYNPIPSLATPTNIFQTTEKTNGNDVRGLNIGMKLGQNIESGSYDNKLIFSVVTNPYVEKAVMTEGDDFNKKLKSIQYDGIEHFKKSTVAPDASKWVVKIDDEESDYEIKLWYNSPDNTAYYFSEAETIYLNKDSSYMFFTRSDDTRIKNIQDIDVSHFNTSMVTNMGGMFSNKPNLTSLNLSNFDTSKVTDMHMMFYDTSGLTSLDISNFDTSQVTNMRSMFEGMTNLTSLDVSSFNTSKVKYMGEMFYNAANLSSLNLSNFDTSNVTYMDSMFSGMTNLNSLDVSSFNTSNVIKMSSMFAKMANLTSLNISSFNTSQVTDMGSMFQGSSSLSSLNLSSFDTSNVIYMSSMFYEMTNLSSLNLSNFNTSKVTRMDNMFDGMKNLISLDISNFDTSNVTSMGAMFYRVNSLTSLNLSSFNTSKVTDMHAMFQYMYNLTSLNISNFDTSKVTDMSGMFSSTPNLISLDISNFDTSNVTNMRYMFSGAYGYIDKLEKIYVNNDFNTTKVRDFYGIFNNRKKLRGGNGSYLADPNSADKTWLRVDRPGVQGYFTRKS